MNRLQSVAMLAVALLMGAAMADGEQVKPAEGLGLMPGVKTAEEVSPAAKAVLPAPALQQPKLTFPPNVPNTAVMPYPGTVPMWAQFPQANVQPVVPYRGYTYPPMAYYPAYPYAAMPGYAYPQIQRPMLPPYAMRPPVPQQPKKQEKKPWGDTRYIWPDFYTDFTNDTWDKMINAPYEMGYMPGGWRFPSLSSPDPVTVGDAVTNQFPPIMEEAGNFVNFAK